MKRYIPLLSLLLLLLAFLTVFSTRMPSDTYGNQDGETGFSTERALKHVKAMSTAPHAVGFPAHKEVRNYLEQQLQSLGLQPVIQQGYTAGDWGNLSRATNIIARLNGSGDGKALLLLSHYDSNPHSSFGASDAASGVAAILETMRAFLASGTTPVNDIIVLFTDAEELGLNGADIFVNQHPWAKDVGLVLNFEARGSGGPSYMFLETNGGNQALIQEFMKAGVEFPAANSLAYSVYKLLPNDTDLTVFREDGNIQGFNFAFIDDHYDYHTALDRYDRLDPSSLAHQGSYLFPLLQHMSQVDLSTLSRDSDMVYANIPFFGLITYPYSWIWPMFFLAVITYIVLLTFGRKKQLLSWRGMAKGFIPALLSLLVNLLIGYFSWTVILWLYPEYRDILQGFPYNGYWYIGAMAALAAALSFIIYSKFDSISIADKLPSVILIWLLLCGALSYFLAGAAFFILPVFALLAAFFIILHPKETDPIVLALLCVPAIWIVAPFIEALPVGLGLKLLVTTTLFVSLLFYLLLPLLDSLKLHRNLALLGFILFLGMMIAAHFRSGFSEEQPHPSSLVYLLNADTEEAYWASYNHQLSSWNTSYYSQTQVDDATGVPIFPSKYQSGFTKVAAAPVKSLGVPLVEKLMDTLQNGQRILKILYRPQRAVNRLDIYTNPVQLNRVKVNGVFLEEDYLGRRGSRLLTHYISENDVTQLEIELPVNAVLELSFFESANNLLSHPEFSVPSRPKKEIPMPFVLNDATVIMKKVLYE
ncbi:MAG: M20/M25/M40 family metallo-hydrolase [Flavobacteriaceae bacterium]|nr:M20/M25/M40 family metallo-hydrolase [Flavobacteriaceae bacterium]